MVQECVQWFGDLSPNVAVTVRAAQTKDAQILSQNVPATMVAGQTYAVSMTLKNVGTQSWNLVGPQCNAYRLGTANSNNWGLTGGRVELPATVGAGQEVTLTFSVTAPTTTGTYDFQWRMVSGVRGLVRRPQPGTSRFVVRSAQAKDGQVLSQTVPPVMAAGVTYPVSVKVKNVGSTSWSPVGPACNAYRLGAITTSWTPTRAELPAALAPGQEVTLSFSVTAPATPGTYGFQWRMVQECVVWFGDTGPNTAVVVN